MKFDDDDDDAFSIWIVQFVALVNFFFSISESGNQWTFDAAKIKNYMHFIIGIRLTNDTRTVVTVKVILTFINQMVKTEHIMFENNNNKPTRTNKIKQNKWTSNQANNRRNIICAAAFNKR